MRLLLLLPFLLQAGCATVDLLRGPHRYTQEEMALIRTDAAARFSCPEQQLRVVPERTSDSVCDGTPPKFYEVVRAEGCGQWLHYGDAEGGLLPVEREVGDASLSSPWLNDGVYLPAFPSHAHTPEEVLRVREHVVTQLDCPVEALTVSRRLIARDHVGTDGRGFSPGPIEEILVTGCGKYGRYVVHRGTIVSLEVERLPSKRLDPLSVWVDKLLTSPVVP
ncbi:hypothetical protein [Corallococcus sp. AB011P]|uniref:hypothetical protein n=1 Tax=Corallococcus sp. AB011P TaxID=2316735 RepID=UPI0011C36867|nr:hypothetical protein [Corallococcus sp. AB011P]